MANTEKTKILLIDDDKTLLLFLEKFFREEGYDVFSSDRGRTALKMFFENQPDLVILDLMMPGMDGWEVCARIRELAETPIILLSAKSGEAEKLRGFRLGVDDYVTKPFSMAELAARSQAVLHRTKSSRKEEEVTAGPLKINLKKKRAEFEGKPLDLTPTEFRLLVALVQRSGETVSQEELHETVWGDYSSSRRTALRRYIWLLRQKIEHDPASPTLLVAVRGFGYRLDIE